MEKIVVLSDIQSPYEDKRAVRNVIDFIKDYRPDRLASSGDELDAPQASRWTKGYAGEYAGTLQRDINGLKELQAKFRDAVGRDKEYSVVRSNHVDRLERYIARYAPAFSGLDALNTESLLGYDELGITFHREPYELAPGWFLMHGDEGSLSPIAGRTATNLAVKVGASVVCGHTHRAGISAQSYGINGKITKTVYGLEIGNLMDMKQAGYLKTGSANWQQAFGILHVEGKKVSPQLVYIQPDGSFVVDGRKYNG